MKSVVCDAHIVIESRSDDITAIDHDANPNLRCDRLGNRFANIVAPSELYISRVEVPGVVFAMRTYPRLKTAIASAIPTHEIDIRDWTGRD